MTEKRETRPLGELFGELTQETRLLIQQEVALAKVELSEKINRMVKDAIALGAGAVLLYTGLLVLVAAIVLILGLFMPLWGSALLVAIVILAVGGMLLMKGVKDMKQMRLSPERTTESVKEAAKWIRSELK